MTELHSFSQQLTLVFVFVNVLPVLLLDFSAVNDILWLPGITDDSVFHLLFFLCSSVHGIFQAKMLGCNNLEGWERVGGGREGTYVYLWLTHVDVWQKSNQYCKAIILQLKLNFLKMLGWVAISSFRGSSRLRDWACIFYASCLASGFFTTSTTWKALSLSPSFFFFRILIYGRCFISTLSMQQKHFILLDLLPPLLS